MSSAKIQTTHSFLNKELQREQKNQAVSKLYTKLRRRIFFVLMCHVPKVVHKRNYVVDTIIKYRRRKLLWSI